MIISKLARERYNIDEFFINYEDILAIFDDYLTAKLLAEKINKIKQVQLNYTPDEYVRASVINALGLIDELYLKIIDVFYEEYGNDLHDDLINFLIKDLGEKEYFTVLKSFTEFYPNNKLFNKKEDFEEFYDDKSDGKPNKHVLIDTVILAFLANENNAISKLAYGELLETKNFKSEKKFTDLFASISKFFQNQPPFPNDATTTLIEYLEKPLREGPNLENQLKYIQTYWGKYFNSKQLTKLLNAIAYILEENDAIWRMFHPGGAFSPILTYSGGDYEAFSPDKDWMPNVVMIAKSTYVWLDQLSKKYQRQIHRLDQIPDEELSLIRNRGINAIWLIGLWERSNASKTLKHIMGNPDAEASAYSLRDYAISEDLGGHYSYEKLRDRAKSFGIKLASDMVPNHMGIDSNLIYDRPDLFISLNHSPFPTYTFNGHNYSQNPDIGIFVEDHYYNHSDAAVVFKHVNFKTGQVRYIFHGNDGTSIPWNDTAQLDFLKEEVRNWVIEKIIQVARMFPIIRFDAAMTLAKNQFQRLWYPIPGTPAAVASRSSYTVSDEQFNQFFPKEFWRDVVDIISEKVPDTLLLAEAFWMLEGYFVRTLGMHRVYNSAFMNMLKSELNDQYRITIKNTIEFDPEILKRFVNFMNNPDEDTAVAQFGKGDKYFGVLLMMATMPGLPMFGHGQIEGFSEKYGMEFKRSYWNEQEDYDLIKRHEYEIFPLLHQRWLFSEVRNFRLFDFYRDDGSVDENVFAYSNGQSNKRTLIVYHNKYASTAGWIKTSAQYLDRWTEPREFKRENLSDALLIQDKPNSFVIFKDSKAELEYIRKSKDIHDGGMFLILGAYQYHIFMNFQQVEDTSDRIYQKVCDYLAGNGVKSVHETMLDLEVMGIQQSASNLLKKQVFLSLENSHDSKEFFENYRKFLKEISFKRGVELNFDQVKRDLNFLIGIMYAQDVVEQIFSSIKMKSKFANEDFETLFSEVMERNAIFFAVICFLFVGVNPVNQSNGNDSNFTERSLSFIDQWRLKKIIIGFFKELSFSYEKAEESLMLTQILIKYYTLPEETYPSNFTYYIVYDLFNDPLINKYLKINYYENEFWYNKERFNNLMVYLTFNILFYNRFDLSNKLIPKLFKMMELSENSEFKISKLRKLLKESENSTIIRPMSLSTNKFSSLESDEQIKEKENEEKEFKVRTKKVVKKTKKE